MDFPPDRAREWGWWRVLGGIHSLSSSFLYKGKNQHSLYLFFFLRLSTACRSCGCHHWQFGNFTGPRNTFSGMGTASHPGTLCTLARHRCRQAKELLQQVIGHHQIKKKKKRNSTVWTLANKFSTWQYLLINEELKKKKVQKKGRQGSEVEGMCSYRFSSELSFPMLVHFVGRFASAFWGSLSVAGRAQIHLVHLFERLVQVVLKWGHGGADGRRAEAVGDEAEVGQAALDARFHNGGRSWVSKRRAVLCQQVCELLADLPEGREKLIAANRTPTESFR